MSRQRWLAVAVLAALLASMGALATAAQTPTPTPLALPAATGQPSPQFVSMMLGCAETPPVTTMAEGAAVFQMSPDGSTMNYVIWAFNIRNLTEAHIHQGAVGQAGPIVVWLYPAPSQQAPKTISGLFNGLLATGTITSADLIGPLQGKTVSDLMQQMQAGNTYANIHTTANPAGEVRGQIVSTSGTAGTPAATAVSGAAATPSPAATGSPAATAAASPIY